MKYKDNFLTTNDFNDKISGVNKTYNCWRVDFKTAKTELSCGKNLICLSSVFFPKGGHIIREYTHIGFYKTVEDFFSIDFNTITRHFFFIPTNELTEEQIINIILDIKNKHNISC
ncbi:MAG: hypothetical protein QM535_13365 [Limnohabitans sp.]|nr:hypothetical protein [Limnohabitans sp.]